MKAKEFKEAITKATKALELQPSSAKALYRRGQAHAGLSNFVSAREDYEKGRQLHPTDVSFQTALEQLEKTESEAKAREKDRYKKMFAAMSSDGGGSSSAAQQAQPRVEEVRDEEKQ